MRISVHNSTSGETFNPKSHLLFPIQLQILATLLPILCVFERKKTAFVMYIGIGGGQVGSKEFFNEISKIHILYRFHAFWATVGANRFTFLSLTNKGDTTKVAEWLYFTYWEGIPLSTKFNQNKCQSYQVWKWSVERV